MTLLDHGPSLVLALTVSHVPLGPSLLNSGMTAVQAFDTVVLHVMLVVAYQVDDHPNCSDSINVEGILTFAPAWDGDWCWWIAAAAIRSQKACFCCWFTASVASSAFSG